MLSFDIDGVVADLTPYFLQDIADYAECDINDINLSCHDITVPNPAIQGRDIYNIAMQSAVKHVEKIQPYPYAIEFLKEYNRRTGNMLVFITARQGDEVMDATYRWINRYLFDVEFSIFFNEDKISVLKQNTYVTGLVEDRFKTANLASEHVKSFLVNRPWNMGRIAENSVIRIDNMQDIWKYIE